MEVRALGRTGDAVLQVDAEALVIYALAADTEDLEGPLRQPTQAR